MSSKTSKPPKIRVKVGANILFITVDNDCTTLPELLSADLTTHSLDFATCTVLLGISNNSVAEKNSVLASAADMHGFYLFFMSFVNTYLKIMIGGITIIE